MNIDKLKLAGNGAAFSECRNYRYALWRIWNEDNGIVMFIGLNPSTANERENDPTIRRVMSFAYNWGYGGVIMANLFGWITPYPYQLKMCDNPTGDTDKWLWTLSEKSKRIVFAWGKFKEAEKRASEIIQQYPYAFALKINKDGSPRHPLYVPGTVIPVIYKQ
jgi:hypothetical protein